MFHRQDELIKTHILPRLLTRCAKYDESFSEIKKPCEILTNYYVDTRYPDDLEIVEFDNPVKAAQAIELAEQVLKFVKAKIL